MVFGLVLLALFAGIVATLFEPIERPYMEWIDED